MRIQVAAGSVAPLFVLLTSAAWAQCPAGATTVADNYPSGSRRLLACTVNDRELSVRFWHPNGQLQLETLSAPAAPGTPIASKEWSSEGRLLKEVRRQPSGELVETQYDARTGTRTMEGPILGLTFYGDRTERTGKWTLFNPEGRRKQEFYYREPRDDGEANACYGAAIDRSTEYGPGDVVVSTITFDHCAPHGKVVRLHPNGRRAEEVTYDRGKPLGPPLRWSPDGTALVTLVTDGDRTRATIRDANGTLESEGTYLGPVRDGRWADFYPSGQRKGEGTFINDQKDGIWRSWYEDGTPQSEERYSAGLLNGLRRRWHSDGTLAEEEPIANGRTHGVRRSWSSLGILLSATCFQNGLPRWQTTDEDDAARRPCP